MLKQSGIFRDNEQNTNGFEFALCKYISEKQFHIRLKCRIICVEHRSDNIYDATVQTNEGLTHLFAKKVLNMTNKSSAEFASSFAPVKNENTIIITHI